MTLIELIKKAQAAIGASPDGDWGPVSQSRADGFDIDVIATEKEMPEILTPVVGGDYFGARWVNVDLDLLGRDESDPELNRRYAPSWIPLGLPQYKNLMGNAHAWCSVRIYKALKQLMISVKGITAAAASISGYGKKCPFWFGALLDIEHIDDNGRVSGRHTCMFLYWIDKAKRIAATLDGNKGNLFCVAKTNLSGAPGCDRLKTGPRWPSEEPDGQEVSMAEVLAKYPHLKVGSKGNGTR